MVPEAWRRAEARERSGLATPLADPGPERRIARLLAAFIGAGLVFLVLPGTLVGVWNLVSISAARAADRAPATWVQAHGHAQLFGWVGTFMIGICLYAVPKFRGGAIRSLATGWVMFGLWTVATAAHWAAVLWTWQWKIVFPLSAGAQLAVALLLIWQTRPSNVIVGAGLVGLAASMLYQFVIAVRLVAPVIPPGPNDVLLRMALWLFCFPIAWGFSIRFLPVLLGLPESRRRAVPLGLVALAVFPLAAVLLACYSLRIFEPRARPPKVLGVDSRFPFFARLAFGWLVVSAALLAAGGGPGMQGASRHAFTVGFLATLIFAVGPRLLPSFLNSRELWSQRLMLWSLVLLTAGCALRVTAEPLAYGHVLPLAWKVLPVSAVIELTAVLLFALNIGRTLATPMPAWFLRQQVKDTMPLYWYVTSYPATRRLLIEAGVRTLATAREVPRSLTLREAAEAEGLDSRELVERLADFFDARLARTVRRQTELETPS
jgi:hypothetical protein